MHAVEKIVAQALARIGVKRGEVILVALSGGPDSVALLRALVALQPDLCLRLCAAHFNHRLRGDESERDENFARALCEQFAVPLTIEAASGLSADAPNLEEHARALRLEFLRRAASSHGATRIALAHNRDDQAETVLMRLLRGTGVSGLKGMTENGPGNLIRPLLHANRRQILSYLTARGSPWIIDSSNFSLARLRNRVRHELIPLLESRYAPGVSRRLSALATEMEHVDQLIAALACSELERRLIRPDKPSAAPFAEHHLNRTHDPSRLDAPGPTGAVADIVGLESDARRDHFNERSIAGLCICGIERLPVALVGALVRNFIARWAGSLRRVGRAHIDAIVRLCLIGPPNGRVSLPGSLNVRREYDRLIIERNIVGTPAVQSFDIALAVPGVTIIEPAGMKFEAALVAAVRQAPAIAPNEAWFDASKIGAGLRVRNFRPGDRIALVPGAPGRKLKRLFYERRVPRPYRATFPVVTVDGTIVWMPGVARAGYALVDAKTQTALRLRVDPLIAGKQTLMLTFS
jgi:tRNA(Ile)-lysidine synthase